MQEGLTARGMVFLSTIDSVLRGKQGGAGAGTHNRMAAVSI
jgi:hypothetical protein